MKYLISKVEQFLLDVCCNNYILFFIQIFYDFFLCTSTLLIPNAKSRKSAFQTSVLPDAQA